MPLNLDIDPSASAALNQDIDIGSAIRLSIATPYFFVTNGDRKMNQVGGAAYYGGWAVDRDSLHEAGQCWEPPILAAPSYCCAADFFTSNGKAIPVYATRAIIAALIGTRISWMLRAPGGQTRRYKDYVRGSRRHMQMLVYVADKTADKKLMPWGPAVLTVSGYQVGNIIKGIQDWKAACEKILRVEKSPATPWMFYMGLGTFGDDFRQEMVGPPGAQSPITPVGVQVPKNLSSEMLEKLYVGRETSEKMIQIKSEANEWLHAWKNLPGTNQPEDSASAPSSINFVGPPSPPPAWRPEEDNPF